MAYTQAEAAHKVQPKGISFIEVAGDAPVMKEWIGPEYADQIPLRWTSGTPDILAVGIELVNGETITLRTP